MSMEILTPHVCTHTHMHECSPNTQIYTHDVYMCMEVLIPYTCAHRCTIHTNTHTHARIPVNIQSHNTYCSCKYMHTYLHSSIYSICRGHTLCPVSSLHLIWSHDHQLCWFGASLLQLTSSPDQGQCGHLSVTGNILRCWA